MTKKCYYISNQGIVRKNNEDSLQINKKFYNNRNVFKSCYLKTNNIISVCDGMGGEEFGEEASLIAVKHLSKLDYKNPNTDMILNTYDVINDEICKVMNSKDVRMGSTVVTAVIRDNKLDIFNLGDSRAYIFNGSLIQLSKDHTAKHDDPNKKGALTQHLGIYSDEVIIEPFSLTDIDLVKGSYLLLCSDGLYDMVKDDEISEILSSDIKDKKKAKELFERAMKNGGKDNCSFLLVRC